MSIKKDAEEFGSCVYILVKPFLVLLGIFLIVGVVMAIFEILAHFTGARYDG